MRHCPNLRIERYRTVHPTLGGSQPGENWGFFVVERPTGTLRVIATDGVDIDGYGWEHVSVSLASRCPTWEEMSFVKRLFWADDETVLEFHPPKTKYVNLAETCLHLWRKVGVNAELPPEILVGPKTALDSGGDDEVDWPLLKS